MSSPLYGKISSACKSAAKRKFKVWPSAYASGWGVRCTKAGGPSNFGGGSKKEARKEKRAARKAARKAKRNK